MPRDTYVQTSHDPFARVSLVRRIIPSITECGWCGSAARFQYGIERDDRPYRPEWDSDKAFCSIGCRRSYYGEE